MSSTLGYVLGARANELFGDGDWHLREAVIVELGRIVPPGIAIRHNEQVRAMKHAGPRTRDVSVEDRIRYGRRSLVRRFISNDALFERRQRMVDGAIRHEIRMKRPHRAMKGDPTFRRLAELRIENQRLTDTVTMLAPLLDDYVKTLDDFRQQVEESVARLAARIEAVQAHVAEAARVETGFDDDDDDDED
jgi:hypothetical protein